MRTTSDLKLYSTGYVTVSGLSVAEQASVQVTRNTNSIACNTILGGYSGECPGAPNCTVKVEVIVPSTEWTLAGPGALLSFGDLPVVEFAVLLDNGKSLNFKGFVISDNFAYAIDQNAKVEFEARGSFAEWA